MQTDMLRYLQDHWGWIVLRGVAAVAFAAVAVAWPGITLAAMVLVWGAYAVADGVLALVAAWLVRDQGRPFWSLVVVGLLGIGAGVLTFAWPQITALTVLMFIAAWAMLMGAFQVVAAVRLRKEIEGEWLLGLSGVLSMIFGGLMVAYPGAGALAMVTVIAAYAFVFGVLLIVLGFRLRASAHGHHGVAHA
jgi:uncharacterized membrane protein HdeD (DUF308 family)